MPKQHFGDLLVQEKKITPEQLEQLLQKEKESGIPLDLLLVQEGMLSKEETLRYFAQFKHMPFVEKITEQMADLHLLGKVPLKFLRQNIVIPVFLNEKKTIITSNLRELQPLDDLALLMGGDASYALASEAIIIDAINKYYPLETSKEMVDELEGQEQEGVELEAMSFDEKDILEMANDAPIVKLVNHVIYQAAKEGASDIHIEPFEKELRIRYRIDGNMYQRVVPPKRYQGAIISRLKIMAHLNIAEKRVPQDGRIQIKIADKPYDLRVSVLPCNYGERVVMRLFDKSKGVVDIEKLNLSERDLQVLKRMIYRPNGIILVSGPTGSGKTTTLYSILGRLNEPDVTIITVEDPVESSVNGIGQVAVNQKVGLTFAAALRSILRQDPDIVLIGEIRDGETAQIATQAALTGHLVLSTIHTNSAAATPTRLIDMNVEPFLISSSLICVISQRLVRRLCEKCKQVYTPDSEMIAKIGISATEAKSMTFYKPIGCDECLQTGYRGRLPLFEIMEVTEEIGRLIIERSDAVIIQKKAIEQGMTMLSTDGVRAIGQGKTSIDEVLGVAYVAEN